MTNKDIKLFYPEDAYLMGVGAICGMIVGYCNAKNIPFKPEDLETSLKYTPAVIHSLAGAIRGVTKKVDSTDSKRDESREVSGNVLENMFSGAVKGAGSAAVGYGFGYTLGKLF